MRIDQAAFKRKMWAYGVLALVGIGLVGCNGAEDPTEASRDAAVQIDQSTGQRLQMAIEHNQRDQLRVAHEERAAQFEAVLEIYPEADANLRRVLEDVLEAERRLANEEVTGAEAAALREQTRERLSYLRDRELPPDYR